MFEWVMIIILISYWVVLTKRLISINIAFIHLLISPNNSNQYNFTYTFKEILKTCIAGVLLLGVSEVILLMR